MRGIVALLGTEVMKGKDMSISFNFNTDIFSQKLREYLLYWDEIDFPINNILSVEGTPDMDYLQNVGVLKRSKTNIEVGETQFEIEDIIDIMLKSQMQTFLNNNKEQSGSWSLAQPNSKLFLPKESSIQTRTIEIELYNSLPIPTGEVSIEDILEFKERRIDELSEFRYCMDNLYEEILSSNDSERSIEKNITLIQRKIIDIDRLMNESMFKKIVGSMKVNINLSDAFSKGALGILAGKAFNVPFEGAIIGAASSFIKLDLEFINQPKTLPPELKDYAYLYYSQKELNF